MTSRGLLRGALKLNSRVLDDDAKGPGRVWGIRCALALNMNSEISQSGTRGIELGSGRLCTRPFEASSAGLYSGSDWSTGWLFRGGAYRECQGRAHDAGMNAAAFRDPHTLRGVPLH